MKVLVFKYLEDLAPVGGPNGYCFNIKQELDRLNNTEIEFLKDKKESKYKSNSLSKYMSTFFKFLKNETVDVDLNQYDAIHFHSTKEMYIYRKQLKNYKGKIILTMHSPIPYHMEAVENIKKHHKFLGLFLDKHSFSYIDKYAYNRADYILLPCKEAEESFYKHWGYYKKLHDKNAHKFVYIETGINPVKAKIPAEEYRKELGYNNDDFIVAYVGRHNEVKGYDRLIDVATKIDNPNIKFLIGGKEKPLKAPKLDNWKEIGWTNDPYSLINCANVFILPNKETYFDIVLLEVLSLGKTCIISNTGGNKVIINKNADGIYSFDNNDECVSKIKDLYSSNIGHEPNKEIAKLFKENYDGSIFVKKYLEFLKGITNGKQD